VHEALQALETVDAADPTNTTELSMAKKASIVILTNSNCNTSIPNTIIIGKGL
jgi:hypothetical protein